VSFVFTTIDAGDARENRENVVIQCMAGIYFGTRPSEINANHFRISPLPIKNRVHINSIVLLRLVLLAFTVHKKTSQPQVAWSVLTYHVSSSGSSVICARPVAFLIRTDQDLAFPEQTV
jgi:hypothetical protein